MSDFKYEDVIALAKAVDENSITREYQGDYGAHEYLYECMFCSSQHPEKELLVHDLDCPSLIAIDLLTRASE